MISDLDNFFSGQPSQELPAPGQNWGAWVHELFSSRDATPEGKSTNERHAPEATPPLPPSAQRPNDAWWKKASPDDFIFRLYLRDALREDALTEKEERELTWLASFGDEASQQRLVLGHLQTVIRLAFEYQGCGLPLADLINEGNLGLMRAVELFRPSHGVSFGFYASWWIRERLRRALSIQAWPMRLPVNFWRHLHRLKHTGETLRLKLSHPPDDEEIALATGLTLKRVQELHSQGLPRCFCLDETSDEEDEMTWAEILPDDHAIPPDAALATESDRELVNRLLATLSTREQRVLRLRYGLDGHEPRTFDEVGKVLGCVRQAAQKIEAAALAKLQARARLLSYQLPV